MRNYCDLHTHTKASDGSLSSTELINLADEIGLACIALTDHDTVEGVVEAIRAARGSRVKLIPGIEFSADCGHSLHILGYFNQDNYMKLAKYEKWLKESRNKRNKKMIERARKQGILISEEDLYKVAGGNVLTRGHFMKVLIEKGYAKSKEDAFGRFLSPGGLIYARREKLNSKEIISTILNVGGVPVLAHPVLMGLDWEALESFVLELKEQGLMGIEAIYVENSEEDTRRLLEMANKHDLLITGGSDFHGNIKPDISLGVGYGNLRVPVKLAEELIGHVKN